MENLYRTAIQAALEAGIEILSVFHSDNIVFESKADNSPLTLADKNAHCKIVEFLAPLGIPILSEEGKDIDYSHRKMWQMIWIVDPLDGTKEFINKSNEFTVNIALVKDEMPVFGVVYAPALNVLYYGIKGVGSFRIKGIQSNDFKNIDALINTAERLPISMNKPFTVVASKRHMSVETTDFINNLKIEHPNLQFLSIGSSLKFCAVAEGAADVYPRLAPTMEWDTAAGQAVVEAAGGKVVTMNNIPLSYNRSNLLNPWFIVSY